MLLTAAAVAPQSDDITAGAGSAVIVPGSVVAPGSAGSPSSTPQVTVPPLTHHPAAAAPRAPTGAGRPATGASVPPAPPLSTRPVSPLTITAPSLSATNASPAPPPRQVSSAAKTSAPRAAPPPTGARSAVVSAFGDSVLLGAGPALAGQVRQLKLDAVEGRQSWTLLGDVVAAHNAGTLAPVVLIHTGNNGIISPGQLAATLRLLSDRKQVILINDHVDRDWQGPNNKTIAAVGSAFPNVTLIDWDKVAAAHPSWLYDDGLHLDPQGAAAYAHLVAAAIH